MTVNINQNLCNLCNGIEEPLCMRICPGDLFYKSVGKMYLRLPDSCWDCAACVKVCPQQALGLVMPLEIGGQGSKLRARKEKKGICWFLESPDGRKTEILCHFTE